MKKRKLLLALQKRNNARLGEIRSLIENGKVDAEEVVKLETEIEEINVELQEIADELADLDATDPSSEDVEEIVDKVDEIADEISDVADNLEETAVDLEEKDNQDNTEESAENAISPEQRKRVLGAIGKGLSTKGSARSVAKDKKMRKAFANFVVGNISEAEARSLGIVTGQGSVLVPESIAAEVISYAQEENLLRKYGTAHKTKGNVKYPVLVKKAVANATKTERNADMPITDIEFDEILLDPAEFDALATVSKKLVKMSGVDIEEIVVEELKKAYVEKETKYMFNGDDTNAPNPGALAKKAVAYYETEVVGSDDQKLYKQLVKFKGQVPTTVLKKAMWIVNRAALTLLEGMTDTTGRPLLHVDATDGVSYKLLGHKLDFTDAADGDDVETPVLYFGDFASFHIQDVIGVMEISRLVEQFARQNKIGFQIYNLLDGQLIYSPLEPTMYRYEVGATAPVGG